MTQELSIEARRDKVRELLALNGYMPLTELAETLGVSESTIRRDLESLEQQQTVRRTHGGAVFTKAPGGSYAFADHETTAVDEKRAIGQVAASMIAEGQTVIINGGTTCFEVARHLAGRRLSVVTNSLPIASLLSSEMATEVTLLGGYVYPRTGVALGGMTQRQVAEIHGSLLILSCAGLAPEGVFNANQMMVDIEHAMMNVADTVMLVADSSKFEQRAVAKLCSMDAIDMIVTDSAVSTDTRTWLDALQANIVYAPRGD
jgi:DeoR family transcriptional regulator, fructose operon transcriptional repressor